LLLLLAQEACGFALRALPPTWHPHLRRVRLPDGTIALERHKELFDAAVEAPALSFLQSGASGHVADRRAQPEDCPCPDATQQAAVVEAQSKTGPPSSQLLPPSAGQPQLQLAQVNPSMQPLASSLPPVLAPAQTMQAPVPLGSPAAFQQTLGAYQQQAAMEMMQVNSMRIMESQLQNEEVQLQRQIQVAEANLQRQGFQSAPGVAQASLQPSLWPPLPMGSIALPQFAPDGMVSGAPPLPPMLPQQQLLQAPMLPNQAVPAAFPAIPAAGPMQPALLQYWR